jgi:16S rRNA (guanine527-N7)-methyltransferase
VSELWQDVARRAESLFGLEISERSLAELAELASLVQAWSSKLNLVSAGSIEEIAYRHVLDSLAPSVFARDRRSLVDFGSGAGFPGLPLATLHPAQAVSLIESRRHRASFLRHAARTLGLANVTVFESRGEKFAAEHVRSVDAVTGRAVRQHLVAGFARIVLKPGGILVLMRKSETSAPFDEEGFTERGRRRYLLPGNLRHEVVALERIRDPLSCST